MPTPADPAPHRLSAADRLALRRLLAVLAAGVALTGVWLQYTFLDRSTFGLDFYPVRDAARALLAGHSVYGPAAFVYPPTAALVFVPAAAGSPTTAVRAWTLLCLLALLTAAVLVGRQARPGWRVPATAGCVLLLACGTVATDAARLGNVSVLLTLVAVLVLTSARRGRWRATAGWLTCSLLVKPLLVPLAIVPLARRGHRQLAAGLAAGTAVLVAAMLTVPGGRDVSRFVGYVAAGTNLHGANAVNSTALAGWVEAHHVPAGYGWAARAALAALAVAVTVAACRSRDADVTGQLGVLALVTVFLTGSIGEENYLPCLLAGTLLLVATGPSLARFLGYAPAILLLGAPFVFAIPVGWTVPLLADGLRQDWDVAAELALFAAVLTDLIVTTGPRRRPHRPVAVPDRAGTVQRIY